MTELMTQSGFDQAGFEALLSARTEPAWLQSSRQTAWERFLQQQWPQRNEEEWIRTDIRLFKLERFSLSPGLPEGFEIPAGELEQGVDLAGRSVSLDGQSATSQLDPELAEQGVIFGDLNQAITDHPDRLERAFSQYITSAEVDRFASLHAACMTGGHVLIVPRGVRLEKPLYAHSILSEGGSDLGRLLVIVEEGAEATLLSECSSLAPDSSGFHCGAVEIIVANNAHLRFVNLQNWANKVWHFGHQRAIVGKDATLQWTTAAMGAGLAKVNQQVALVGEGASSQVNGVLFTEGKQHLSYHTLQHHQAPHCQSDFLYKSALQDKSRTVWRGMIKVDEAAQRTDGYQRSDNLLLSTAARADSIPGLEIEADDVRCTHGSTTGRVDDELIFYAMCRGFTRREATRAIVIGFFQQIFDRISIESVRDALGDAIAKRVRDYE